MLQMIAVILIVSAAVIYVGRKLLRQMKGHGCEGCDCSAKQENSPQLIQVTLRKESDQDSDSQCAHNSRNG
jgi:hypothetical protein